MVNDMTEAVVVAVLAFLGNALATWISNNKTTALITYCIQQLEERVNKHNELIERTYKLEKHESVVDEKIRVINHRIDDLEKEEKP